jgi:haloalkane dehalogenase
MPDGDRAEPPVAAGLAYREASPEGAPAGTVLMLHGYPESSYMWRDLLPAVAAAGWRGIAPDLAGFGDSPPDRPGTWERHVDRLEAFRTALGLDEVVLVTHDWGGLIGVRWALDHPGHLRGLVVSGTGFFPDGRWHGFAQALRTDGQGEQLLDALDRDGFAGLLEQSGLPVDDEVVDECWKAFADEERRYGQLDLYRSGDFTKIEAYDGRLSELEVPALVLWSEHDPFAPVGGAHRFMRELADARLVIVGDVGHFLFEEAPERCADEIVSYLGRLT